MSNIQIIERSDANGKKNDDSTVFIRQGERAILCIADGIGSMTKSDIASGYCTKLVKKWGEDKDVNRMGRKTTLRELKDLFYKINEDLLAYSASEDESLGTTLIVAVVGIGKMVLASIGDSRVYVRQNGSCKQVTKDQTVAQEEKEGVIDPMFAAVSEENKSTTLTQWLGHGKDRQPPHPKFYEIDLEEDADILLCTDGLYSTFTVKELDSGLSTDDIDSFLDSFIARAKENGETDNISAVLYRRRAEKKKTKTTDLESKEGHS